MSQPLVLQEAHSNYSEIVLNTPKNLNSIYHSEISALSSAFSIADDNSDVKFVIFRGKGRAFCAGGNIKNVKAMFNQSSKAESYIYPYEAYTFYLQLASRKKPTICYMDGITCGGGFTFSQLSSFKIATENSVISLPEGRIGHFLDASNSFFLSRLEGYLGVYLALTGHELKGEDAVFAGLASHFVPSSELGTLGEKLSQLQEINLDSIDGAIQEVAVCALHEPQSYTLFGEKLDIIERCFQYKTVEEIMQALKKENSKFADSCVTSMLASCPVSLKLTLHLLCHNVTNTFYECINYDFRGWRTVPMAYNYTEGVNALLQKRAPQWIPATLEEVPEDVAFKYFSAITTELTYRPNTDFVISPYQRFLQPTASEVQRVMITENLSSHKEIIDWFVKDRKFKFGTRQVVENILNRQRKKTVEPLSFPQKQERIHKL